MLNFLNYKYVKMYFSIINIIFKKLSNELIYQQKTPKIDYFWNGI